LKEGIQKIINNKFNSKENLSGSKKHLSIINKIFIYLALKIEKSDKRGIKSLPYLILIL